jgi:hypothetical protein
VLGLTLIGALPAACGGGSGEVFQTSIPGNTPLGSLSGSQATELCNAEMRFAQNSSLEMDDCHEAAFLGAALTATFSPDMTDAELQAACTSAYTSCLHPDGGAGATQTCTAPPANCTATVGELAACLDDGAAATRALAAQLPDCGSLTRAGLTANDGGTASSLTSSPASCQTLQVKCSGASSAAQSFAQSYCTLVAPCCATSQSPSACEALVLGTAGSSTFDETAATACLAALQARPSGSGFCAGLATLSGGANGFAVIPQCAIVFGSASTGTVAAGQPCTQDGDCAPGPSGPAACEPDIFLSPGSTAGGSFCAVITTKLSDPCIGTASPSQRSFEGAGSPVGYTFCDKDQGLMCSASNICVPIGGLGDPCNSSDQCDGIKTYCEFGSGTCQSRLPAGATCTNAFGACADGSDCASSICKALDGAGVACSAGTFPSSCLAGYCGSNGTCPDPLAGICS